MIDDISKESDDPWQPFHFFLGTWKGTGLSMSRADVLLSFMIHLSFLPFIKLDNLFCKCNVFIF